MVLKTKLWPFSYLLPEKTTRGWDRQRTKPSFLLPVNILSQQTPAMQTALGETGGWWNCLGSNTDTTGNKTTCIGRRAALWHSPQSKRGQDKLCFCLRGGATALSPLISVTASAKGLASGAKSFPNMLSFGGLSHSQREKSHFLQ